MTIWEALVLGIIQGLTEFLPISSDGHLVMAQTLFGLAGDNLPFDVLVHGGTLLATILYFRHRLARIVLETDAAYAGKLALATVPVALVGLAFRDAIAKAFATPGLVVPFLCVTGTALLSLYLRAESAGGGVAAWTRGRAAPSWTMALLIGCAQATALLPGVSRSGSTIVTAIWLGVAPAAAAEFSFLLGIPAVAGALVLESDAMRAGLNGGQAAEFITAAAVAFAAALLAITWVFRLLERGGFRRFGFYCWGAALAFAAYLFMVGPRG